MNHRFGAIVHEHGVSFTTWAPAHAEVALVLDDGPERPMVAGDSGFFTLDVPEARPGQRYWYRLEKGLRPDPASRFQPEGPLGPSQIVDTGAFAWTDRGWPGAPPPHRHVLYELHIGTFTAEGTCNAATKWLPLLADLGVTTLQMMPVADFPGRFGWGYDGVNLFAPSRLYGTPSDLQCLINEAHRLGLAVILDVVYNHFGPVGNFLPEFSPAVRGAPGEWGDLLNYDGEGSAQVREFVVQNAIYWIREFHFDGFRIDATQSLLDTSAEHIISEISRRARAAADGRRLFIVGESEPQETRLLRQTGAYADGLDAIYNEDWHHTAFVALTGRRQAYFTDYQGSTRELAAMAEHGPLYQGQWYSWQKQPRGGFALGLPRYRFVNFLENHDQAANTSVGARLYQRVDAARWRALTALLLLGPAVPMLFQGQEFASSHPFLYFADHDAELARAVEDGRLEFLAQFPTMTTPEMRRAVPGPALRQTFERCKLDDTERTADGPWIRLHRDLLRVRREDEVLSESGTERVRIESSAPAEGILLIRSTATAAERLLIVNLGDDHLSPMNDPLLAPSPSASWAEMWSSEHPCYGGGGTTRVVRRGRWLIPGHSTTLLGASTG